MTVSKVLFFIKFCTTLHKSYLLFAESIKRLFIKARTTKDIKPTMKRRHDPDNIVSQEFTSISCFLCMDQQIILTFSGSVKHK